MGTPHKHAEIIKAWADGALIQYYSEETQAWYDLHSSQYTPTFDPRSKYRIKPEPKKVQIRFYLWNYQNKIHLGSWNSDWGGTQNEIENSVSFIKWISDTEEREFDV